ncbi:MAG: alpha-1,6-glucosidase domain-containing protein [Nitriliruptoraceae bacterium]
MPPPAPDPDDHRDLRWRRAHLVTGRLLTWPEHLPADGTARLHVAENGGLRVDGDQVVGADTEVVLRPDPAGLPPSLADRDGIRHLAGRPVLHLDDHAVPDRWLAGQLAVSVHDAAGRLLAAGGVQTALAIDERYATDEPLGPRWHADGSVSVAVWAPTARRLALQVTSEPTRGAAASWRRVEAVRGDRGVWEIRLAGGLPSTDHLDAGTEGYRIEVEVYDPGEDAVVTNVVTDPWSVGLSADACWSLLVDLDDLHDPTLAPPGWAAGSHAPPFAGQHRMVAYELHVRDHSSADATVPEALRGTYRAFTLPHTAGNRHLARLAEAGVSHLHLLPITDMASVPERRSDPGAGEPAGPAVAPSDAGAASGPYNWGYDPHHWLVPEGSYATDPDGPTRIREVRELVAAVHRLGLRVVLDVVCNHTYRAGRHPLSVLDRVVPGYYHRLDDLGRITTSTCCPNTATEHAMMDRLVLDTVLTWARAYRMDGFRFDLLGHHPAAQARRIRAALDALTLERDGVDGRAIVLYGEGWEFGEVAGDARFVAATQRNLAGSGIGTFDDRLRDALRGGNHVGARAEQGVASGRWWEPNGLPGGSARGGLPGGSARGAETARGDGSGGPGRDRAGGVDRGDDADRRRALELTDLVRLGVAGMLADLAVPCHDGVVRRGRELRYGAAPAGYAGRPQDQVAYVSAHDNETLFDALAAKLPATTSMPDRVRMQVLALAAVLLVQGTPFLHAGSELLRSKSLDRDSYRSGDGFNAIDWTASATRWGVGMPPRSSNPDERDLLAELLRSIPAPAPADIAACRDRVLEWLRIRQRSALFGLPTTAEVARRLRFHLTGAAATPGRVVWSLHGAGRADHDLLLVLNAAPEALQAPPEALHLDAGVARGWRLHPVLARSVDPVVREARLDRDGLAVPARTAAAFVRRAS